MADKAEQGTASASGTSDESSKWQPYWDENYKRYYWSDGNESVSNFIVFCFLSFSSIAHVRFGKLHMVALNLHPLIQTLLPARIHNSILQVIMPCRWPMPTPKVMFVINPM